ncbi:MAG: hypothetical protein ACLFT3_08520 [Cyclobacteriaceae bacterium]
MKKLLFVCAIFLLTFACAEETDSLEEVRMVIEETQCANPWEMAQDPQKYQENIRAYLKSIGINASSVKVLDELPPGTAVCLACDCWSGNNIYITVPASEVEKAQAQGFSKAD